MCTMQNVIFAQKNPDSIARYAQLSRVQINVRGVYSSGVLLICHWLRVSGSLTPSPTLHSRYSRHSRQYCT